MHTSLSKKLLAGLLSLVMVLSLVAPSMGTQAASKYSLTDKKSVKSDVTYKYQLKGVSKNQYVKVTRNVSGETVKYNKKAVSKTTKIKGTGKTLNLYVTYGEKAENYTGKFTVKVYSKKTNKVAKTLVEKVTVKVPEKEAVTSVAINNTTPKVDDTLTATVTPADATNVVYAWYMGDAEDAITTQIEGATTATLTVTEAMVGKFIKVQVTGDNESVAEAKTTAKVEAKAAAELAITAKQIGASKIEITANQQVASTDKVTIKRGTSTVDNTFTVDETGKILTVITGAKLADAEYDITVTPADTKKAAASTKLTAKVAKLTKIDFVGDNLVLKDTDFKEAAVKIFGYNDFEEKIALPSLTPYTTKGTSVKYEASSNEIVVTTNSTAPFTSGEQITITAIYQDGTNVQQVSRALTISARASLAKIEFGELATTNTALKGKAITINNMKTGTYYKTVKAEDQYGNALTAKDLNKMMYSSTNTKGTLFVTPNMAAGSYVYLDSFDTDTKDNVVARFKLGDLAMAGTQNFTYTAVGGFSATDSIAIVDNPFIAELNVTAPEMYGNTEAELTITAKDQDGNVLDLYDYVDKSVNLTATTTAQEFSFADKNSVTKASSKLTIPKDMAFKVVKNTTKKTVKFTVTPASNATANNVTYIIVVQSAKPAVNNVTCVVQSDPTPYSISNKLAVTGSNAVTLKSGKALNFNNNVVLLDQYGASYNYVATSGVNIEVETPITDQSHITTGKYTVQYKDKNGALVTNPTAVNVAGKYTAELWYDEDGAASAFKAKLLDAKTFTVSVADTKYSNYTASLKSADKLLYIGGQLDKEVIKVTAQDSTGTTVTLDAGADYTVQIADVPDNSGAVATCVAATGVISSVPEKAITYSATTGEVKGELTANVFVGSELVASVKVPYSNAPQKTASYVCYKGAKANGVVYDLTQGITIDSVTKGGYTMVTTAGANVLYIDIDENSAATLGDANCDYQIHAVDQYGLSNFNAALGSGTNFTSNALFGDAGTVTLSGTKTETFKVETKDSSYKKVLTHVSGTFEKVAPVENTASAALAASFVDQYGKAMTVTAKSAANMTGDRNNGSTATMQYEYDAEGKIKITVTKGGSGNKGAVVGDKWTVTDTTNTASIVITVTCTKSATDPTTDNAGAEFTVTASYN